jgi:lipid-A-disaccharide synthase
LDTSFISELARSGPVVTILPGSRRQEVAANMPWFVKTVEIVHRSVPQGRFVVASFNEEQAAMARRLAARTSVPIEIYVGRTHELIKVANCCLACSGSVSLELLCAVKPTVIHYWIGRSAYWAQWLCRRTRYITLVNLLADGDPFRAARDRQPYDPDAALDVPFPEYLTCEDRSSQMAHHLVRWLLNPPLRQQVVNRLTALRSRAVKKGASRRAARYVLGRLNVRPVVTIRPHFVPPPTAELPESAIGV